MWSNNPEQNNICPVAITPEVRPRRRRIYIVRVLKVKMDGLTANGSCLTVAIISTFPHLACVCICCCAPCFAFLTATKERMHCVSSAGVGKTVLPKAVREA